MMFSKSKKTLIGMIHLPPLAGYPDHPGLEAVIAHALKELSTLEKAGYDGVLIENDNDQPHKINVSNEVLVCFEAVVKEVIKMASIYVGIEVLYDMPATLKLAYKTNADFVRFDVFSDDVTTQWGVVKAQGNLLNQSNSKNKKAPLILADVHVKHANLVKKKSLEESIKQTDELGSDAIIITGDWTGMPPLVKNLNIAKQSSHKPILIGSGLTYKNAQSLLVHANGAIVGSSIKTNGFIDLKKAIQLSKTVARLNV